MKRIAALSIVTFLAACDGMSATDLCMQHELFRSCMASVPAEPGQTNYTEWSKVVKACDVLSQRQSQRPQGVVRPECKAW